MNTQVINILRSKLTGLQAEEMRRASVLQRARSTLTTVEAKHAAAAKEVQDCEALIQMHTDKIVQAQFEAWPQFVCMGDADRRHRWLSEDERCAISRFCQASINPLAIALKFGIASVQTVERYANYCE